MVWLVGPSTPVFSCIYTHLDSFCTTILYITSILSRAMSVHGLSPLFQHFASIMRNEILQSQFKPCPILYKKYY